MTNMLHDIAEFHNHFGIEYQGPPRQLPPELLNFRTKFLIEELGEYRVATSGLIALTRYPQEGSPKDEVQEAQITDGLEQALDGLVDLVYVALGNAYLHGFNFQEAWNRVHAANMAKVRAEKASDSKRGSTFDVIKPDGWESPVLTDLVADHCHRLTEEEGITSSDVGTLAGLKGVS